MSLLNPDKGPRTSQIRSQQRWPFNKLLKSLLPSPSSSAVEISMGSSAVFRSHSAALGKVEKTIGENQELHQGVAGSGPGDPHRIVAAGVRNRN